VVPVEDCITTTGAMTGKGCGGMGGGGIGDGVWGAVKEGEGCEVTVDGEDFGEEVGGVDEAGKEDKTEELLAGPLLSQSRRMSIDLDFFGLTEEVARPMAHSLSTNRRGGDCHHHYPSTCVGIGVGLSTTGTTDSSTSYYSTSIIYYL
jgi:hypothetical protein